MLWKSELSIKQVEFVLKVALAIGGLLWLFFASDELIERKKSLLGSGLWPVGDTHLTFSSKRATEDGSICQINGQYTINNLGLVPFQIEMVEFKVGGPVTLRLVESLRDERLEADDLFVPPHVIASRASAHVG